MLSDRNRFRQLVKDDIKELDKNFVPNDLKLPMLIDRYIRLFEYGELVQLCTQIRDIDDPVVQRLLDQIWEAKTEYELLSAPDIDEFARTCAALGLIAYLSFVFDKYELKTDTLRSICYLLLQQGPKYISEYHVLERCANILNERQSSEINVSSHAETPSRDVLEYVVENGDLSLTHNIRIIKKGLRLLDLGDPIVLEIIERAYNAEILNQILSKIVSTYPDHADLTDLVMQQYQVAVQLDENRHDLQYLLNNAILKNALDIVEAVLVNGLAVVDRKTGFTIVSLIERGQIEMVKIILPYINDDLILGYTLNAAAEADEPELAEHMAALIQSQKSLGYALTIVIKAGMTNIAKDILERVTEEEALGFGLTESIKSREDGITERILSRELSEKTLGFGLTAAVNSGNAAVVGEIASRITNQKLLVSALTNAIRNGNDAVIDALLSRITKGYLLEKTLQFNLKDAPLVKKLVSKIRDQNVLGTALKLAINGGQADTALAIIPKVNSKIVLDDSLALARSVGMKDVSAALVRKLRR